MQSGEVAAVTIEPEWAYGKKGQPEAGIGPNQTLWFEITLDRIGAWGFTANAPELPSIYYTFNSTINWLSNFLDKKSWRYTCNVD